MGNFFTDVIRKDRRYNSAKPVDDVELLEPTFRAEVMAVIAAAHAKGIDLRCTETFRSQALQQHYFDKGTTKLRTVGVHHYGLACDLVEYRAGKPIWNRPDNYAFLGPIARNAGLVWGGDWDGNPKTSHTIYDGYHVQRVLLGDQPRLFSGEWYPDASYVAVPGAKIALGDTGKISPPAVVVKPSPVEVTTVVKVPDLPAPVPITDKYAAASAKLSGNQKIAFDTALRLNRGLFQNWFYLVNLMAFMDVESDFDFDAFRQEPSGVASYGAMQVLDTTAAGLTIWGYDPADPESMYEPEIGIKMGMAACCQNWNVLAARLGRTPTIEEWVMAYNEGAGAVLDGRRVERYWNEWQENRDSYVALLGEV